MPYTPPASSQVDLTLSAPLPDGAGLVLGATAGPQPYSPPPFGQVALVLDQPLPANADLVLGGGGGDVTPDVFDASLSGAFGLRMAASARQIHAAQMQGAFGLRASMSAGYDNSVFRGLQTPVAAGFDSAAVEALLRIAATWEPGAAVPVDNTALFDEAPAQIYVVGAGWMPARSTPAEAVLAHQQVAHPVPVSDTSAWGYAVRTHQSVSALADNARPAGASTGAAHGHGAPQHVHSTMPWHASATPKTQTTYAPHHRAATAHSDTRHVPWQGARLVISNGGTWTPFPPPPPPTPGAVNLRLCRSLAAAGFTPFAVNLVLGVDPCSPVVPGTPLSILAARFYMAVHDLQAHLLPDLTPLPIYSVGLGADVGSFAWTFSASGPASLFDALAPTGGLPASLRVTLDGMQWTFVVDSLQRTEQYGQRGTRVTGRSATALVGAPYARETSRLGTAALNAQQLAAQALDLSGVDLDWGIDDWLVPAGAWSHTGTPLSAVQAIAEAVGGYVNSHRSSPTLLVRHPYPTLPGGIPGGPWNWGGAFAADVELAPDAIITSSIERRDGPDVDAVYVSGTNQGVLAHVKRTGTAGAKLASMAVDPLITANIAAQQLGLSVLGAAGAKHLVQISLPVLTGASQPGVLDVGQLVQINQSTPWRGRVRSVNVSASQPKVRQSITLERHL